MADISPLAYDDYFFYGVVNYDDQQIAITVVAKNLDEAINKVSEVVKLADEPDAESTVVFSDIKPCRDAIKQREVEQ